MDLHSYINLKEAYKAMNAPQAEVVSEEVEAVEEEILDENRQNRANELRAARQSAAASKPEPTSGGAKSFADRIAARRSSSPAAKANTNSKGQNVKGLTGSSSPKPPATSGTSKPPATSGTASAKLAAPKPAVAKPAAPKPAVAKAAPAPKKDTMASSSKSDRMAAWAKANPKLANKPKTPNPLMSKPVAKPTPAASTSSSRLNKALSNIKPMKEDVSEFDLIIEYLVDSGFPKEEALKLMVNMDEGKRLEILESYLTEEDADKLRDFRQERGGVDGNTDYKRAPRPSAGGKEKSKEEREAASKRAFEATRAAIEKQYGKGAIMGDKKKKKD